MIKGIIFDLDGTLLNTLYDIQDSLNLTLEKYHFKKRSYEETRMALGNGSRRLIVDSIDTKLSEEETEEILKDYLINYRNNYSNKTCPYEGIKELLKSLKERKIKIAINSNKPDDLTKKLIEKHFSDIDFIKVIGQRDGIPNKPDPYTNNEIISEMNLNNEEILYVGDSDTDILTAKNSNLKSISCLWGFRDKNILISKGTDILLNKPSELLNYLN